MEITRGKLMWDFKFHLCKTTATRPDLNLEDDTKKKIWFAMWHALNN